MLRVGDLDKSIQYYTEALGMKVIRKSENESQKYTLAFLGYGEEEDNVLIELTYNWGKGSEAYTKGNAYAQIALSTEVSTGLHLGSTRSANTLYLLHSGGYIVHAIMA